jgi:hypothetical protein
MEDEIPSLSSEAQKKDGTTPVPEPSDTPDMPKRSRLSKSLESNSKKTLLLSLLGIIAIISLIALLGIPFLEKFADFVTPDDSVQEETAEEAVVLLPPYLDPAFEATNSAEITLSGTAEEGDKVKLYNNGKLAEEVRIGSDATFEFRDVTLKEGDNHFKVKAFKERDESKFSDQITVRYLKEAPELTIDYPQEGQGISNKDGDRLQIEGTTKPNVKVNINDFQAIVADDGKFKYVMSIKGGENVIKAVATDEAGNKTEMERKFNYNP